VEHGRSTNGGNVLYPCSKGPEALFGARATRSLDGCGLWRIQSKKLRRRRGPKKDPGFRERNVPCHASHSIDIDIGNKRETRQRGQGWFRSVTLPQTPSHTSRVSQPRRRCCTPCMLKKHTQLGTMIVLRIFKAGQRSMRYSGTLSFEQSKYVLHIMRTSPCWSHGITTVPQVAKLDILRNNLVQPKNELISSDRLELSSLRRLDGKAADGFTPHCRP
jgi:hypothetical protein